MADFVRHVDIDFLDAKLEAIRERMNGMDKALAHSSREMERRLEGLNELREEFTRNRDAFMLKEEFNEKHRDIGQLEKRVAKLETRSIVWTGVIAFLLVLFEVVMRVIKV